VLIESPAVLEEVEEKSFVFEFYEALKRLEVLEGFGVLTQRSTPWRCAGKCITISRLS
jgi:hypothetical protein